jgi:hypothetical protein
MIYIQRTKNKIDLGLILHKESKFKTGAHAFFK